MPVQIISQQPAQTMQVVQQYPNGHLVPVTQQQHQSPNVSALRQALGSTPPGGAGGGGYILASTPPTTSSPQQSVILVPASSASATPLTMAGGGVIFVGDGPQYLEAVPPPPPQAAAIQQIPQISNAVIDTSGEDTAVGGTAAVRIIPPKTKRFDEDPYLYIVTGLMQREHESTLFNAI